MIKKITSFFLLLDLARDSAASRASIAFQFFVRNSCDVEDEEKANKLLL